MVQLLVFFMVVLKFSSSLCKTGCPFRPIVSSVNTYNYNLASFLVTVLKPICTNQFTIKDSFTFVDWSHKHNNIRDLKIHVYRERLTARDHVTRARRHVLNSRFERQEVGFHVSHLPQLYCLEFYFMPRTNIKIE